MNTTHSDVLYVDDDLMMHIVMRRLFTSMGMRDRLLCCGRASYALQHLLGCPKEKLPVAVLLDLNMPTMNGADLLRQIRMIPKLQALHVFVVSSNTGTQLSNAVGTLGVSGILSKVSDLADAGPLQAALAPLWSARERAAAERRSNSAGSESTFEADAARAV